MNHGNHETKMKSKLIITTHLLEGLPLTSIWCTNRWWKYWTRIFVIFHGICKVFLQFLETWWVSCPPGFFQGGRACNKNQIWEMSVGDESITSHKLFFSTWEIDFWGWRHYFSPLEITRSFFRKKRKPWVRHLFHSKVQLLIWNVKLCSNTTAAKK